MKTPTFREAHDKETRLRYALTLGEGDRACAIASGFTKPGWLAFKWDPPATAKGTCTCWCVRDPDGNRYSGIKEAKDAHDGIVLVNVECQRAVGEGDEARLCRRVKEAIPGSRINCRKCPSGDDKRSATPCAKAIASGQLRGLNGKLKWKVVTRTDEVDQSQVQVSMHIQRNYQFAPTYSSLIHILYHPLRNVARLVPNHRRPSYN